MVLVSYLLIPLPTSACIWDSDTLADEKKHSPVLAEAILAPDITAPDVSALAARIEKLRAAPQENEPAWWNDLAGAYLRLDQPAEALKILEPLTNRFAEDYGIHANLGTAYHLLGRYQEAEREIARDLEINPDAHFGLEKYHLALLQYLMRDENYRLRHVFVDEFTESFLVDKGFHARARGKETNPQTRATWDEQKKKKEADDVSNTLREQPLSPRTELYAIGARLCELADSDEPPQYRSHWYLAEDQYLEKGVIYMASLNRTEPACWVMLGILATRNSDKNLTISAFTKAIQLGSVQAPILRAQIDLLRKHIAEAQQHKPHKPKALLMPLIVLGIGLFILARIFRSLWRDVFSRDQ
jgi:tetratricopeptide (TPR) repeat protein